MAETQFNAAEMTLEQWADLDEDEPGELVDGRLEEEEVPNNLHELIVSWLTAQLWNWLVPRGGLVFGSELKFAVRARRGRKPDLSILLPGRKFPAASARLQRKPPDMVIEVMSPSPRDQRRDRLDKMDDYAAFGVRWHWIVDPVQRLIEIYERDSDAKYKRVAAAADGLLAIPGCEGLALPLDQLWQLADRLPESDEDEPAT
jgi:Uma2 family endonuclease